LLTYSRLEWTIGKKQIRLLFFVSKWRSHNIVVGTIDYVVENLATRSGISPFLVRGVVILVTIPFFLAVAKYTHWILWLHGVRPSLSLYRNPYGIIIVSYIGIFFIAMYFATQRAIVGYKWCADTPEGIRTFDAPGKDPVYGISLAPCTLEQAEIIRGFVPQRIEIEDARQFSFYDATGKPRVWYHKLVDGTYMFYDKAGKYPGSGEALLPIDQTTIQNVIRLQEGAQAHARRLESERATERATEPYIDTSVARGGGNQIAVLIFPKDQQEAARGADEMVASALSEKGFTTTLTFFKPAFVSDGRARRLFSGDWSGTKDLEIANRVKYVILGESNATFESSSQFDGLITTNLSLDLKCLNATTHEVCGSRNISATGAGYSKDASSQNALERARPELVSFARLIPR